jgi:hypothetical protein
VTEAQQPHPQHETETEVIPPVSSGDGIARTRELPVVEDEPTVVTPRVAPPEPVTVPRPQLPESETSPSPSEQPTSPPPTAPAPPSAAPAPASAAPAPAGAVPARGRRLLVPALVAALVVLAVVAGAAILAGRGIGSSGSSQAASVKLPSTVTSFDPSGGSGFRQDGTAWRTQTYVSPDFGGLKDGVGLVLDVGAPRTVGRVTFDVVGAPMAVELRAGDSSSGSASGFQRVATESSASGSTTLTVKGGGQHRYWVIWVTKLGAADGGYRAVIQAPTAFGPRS